MKLVNKPVDAMVVFRAKDRHPRPYKFKIEQNGEILTIFVDQVLRSQKTMVCGAENILYECQSVINGMERRFELKYYCSKCEWHLYKI